MQVDSKYIFDVDGTLTPSRQKIEHEFWAPFLIFCRNHDVYLVTGSDRQKTLEQLGLDICYTAKRVYNCSGSDAYERDVNVYRDIWELPKEVEKVLEDALECSSFPIRNGVHIERRPGQVNFSILGRGKDPSVGREDIDLDQFEPLNIPLPAYQDPMAPNTPPAPIQGAMQSNLGLGSAIPGAAMSGLTVGLGVGAATAGKAWAGALAGGPLGLIAGLGAFALGLF